MVTNAGIWLGVHLFIRTSSDDDINRRDDFDSMQDIACNWLRFEVFELTNQREDGYGVTV